MKIAIAGGNGFIGGALSKFFVEQKHQVYVLTRQLGKLPSMSGITYVSWMHQGDQPQEVLEGVDAVINLAGLSLNSGRWTASRKAELVESRLSTTREINVIIAAMKQKPSVLINASAVGYYGIARDKTFTEQDEVEPSDFLAHIVNLWEQEALKSGVRTVFMRLGVVLGAGGGAFPKIVLPYKLLVGGRLGSGKQPVSWIHIDDVVRAAQYCIANQELHGAVNFTAPEPVTMDQLGRAIGRTLRSPHYFPVPSVVLRLALGEMSMLLLEGQRVLPQKLTEHGYTFQFPKLEQALSDLLHSD